MRFDQAIASYESGDWPAAKAAANAILKSMPGNGDALHLLAVIAQDEGLQAEAEALVCKAILTSPAKAFIDLAYLAPPGIPMAPA